MGLSRDELVAEGVSIGYMRVRGFPFGEVVKEFVERHDTLFVVEQNRDAQLRTLLVNETGCEPSKLVSVINYGGQPLSKEHVLEGIRPVVQGTTAEVTS